MRLIDADALMENAQVYEIECGDEIGDDVREIKAVLASRIESAPTIDPVKHGKWIFKGTSTDGKKVYECSTCHADIYATGNFCKECGARMDGEV